jgi:hypothetical protein
MPDKLKSRLYLHSASSRLTSTFSLSLSLSLPLSLSLSLSLSLAICLSYSTHSSISLSAPVTYPSPCYHSDLLYQQPHVTDLLPTRTLYIPTFQKLILILLIKIILSNGYILTEKLLVAQLISTVLLMLKHYLVVNRHPTLS